LKIEHVAHQGLNKYTEFDNKIVFKINVTDKERKHEAAHGSRHDELIRTISNNGKYGVGCTINTNLLFKLFRDAHQKDANQEKDFSVFLIQIGDTAKRKAFEIVESLRKEGILAKTSLSKDSLRAQISMAEKEKVNCILIIGQEEVIRGEVILRDFQSGLQESVSFAKLIPNLIKRKAAN
jgi:histidyl-tRNA synthetase